MGTVEGLFERSTAARAIAIVLALAAGLSLVAPTFLLGSDAATPRPVAGVIDLRNWDFAQQGAVSLSGEWQFHDRQWAREAREGDSPLIATVPGAWPVREAGTRSTPRINGHGTYRLLLKLPETTREVLGIDTGYFLSAYRVYANGALIAESGVPSATAAGETATAYGQVAPLPSGDVELRIEVSNHLSDHGGSFMAPRIATLDSLARHLDLIRLLSMFMVGCMVFAALYHIVVFAIYRVAYASLWFGIVALLLGLRTLFIDPLAAFAVPLLGQDLVWRLDFAASMLLLPTVYNFMRLSFPRHVHGRFAAVLGVACGFGAFLTLAAGPAVGEKAMNVLEIVSLLVIMYLTWGVLRATLKGEPGALVALTGWILSAGATIHDILINTGAIESVNLMPFGFLAFFLCLSGMLVARHRDAFIEVEARSRRTKEMNDRLETAVAQRTSELQDMIAQLQRQQDDLERARMEAVAANQAKSRFLATMSHELRTPLNSILGFSELIRDERLGPVGDGRYRDYAGHIHEGGTHLLELISDILDLSRIEAGKMDLQPEVLDLHDVVAAAMRHAATRTKHAEGVVQVRLDGTLPLVRADRRSMLQVLVNLLSNALKFTPAGGDIILSGFQRADGGVSLRVADSGIGMDPEDIPKALAAFSQVDDGHARQHEGTGLGLPIVRSLMELHGGSLQIESRKGAGLTATVDLPPAATITTIRVAARA